MGWWSKVTASQCNNLLKYVNPLNLTVEEDSNEQDSDFEDKDFLGHRFLDEGPTPKEDSEDNDSDNKYVDEDELTGLQNKANIDHFNAVLARPRPWQWKQNERLLAKTKA